MRLGTIYLTGPSQIINHPKALHYLTKAAENNNSDAQNLVGQMKELGLGNDPTDLTRYQRHELIIPDFVAARYWYKRAASKGHTGAMYNIGCLYESGSGVERDLERAVSYFVLAAKGGHKDSMEKISHLKDLGFAV